VTNVVCEWGSIFVFTSEKKLYQLNRLRMLEGELDFIAAENSMGFHAPQESARILGEAIDFARQGVAEANKKLAPDKPVAAN
jgi:formate-dependent nitrite reductase cytochrome c552 subunit